MQRRDAAEGDKDKKGKNIESYQLLTPTKSQCMSVSTKQQRYKQQSALNRVSGMYIKYLVSIPI